MYFIGNSQSTSGICICNHFLLPLRYIHITLLDFILFLRELFFTTSYIEVIKIISAKYF